MFTFCPTCGSKIHDVRYCRVPFPYRYGLGTLDDHCCGDFHLAF